LEDFAEEEPDTREKAVSPAQRHVGDYGKPGGYPETYEEWEVKWMGGEWRKTIKLRSNVKITAEEVERWNAGFNETSLNPRLYFKAE
jgi:hypothetical protein